ncbi:hypothetical protein ABZ714_13080 [Streptomyces sp. NPDC006798]|uniref:hypothetical protein n=1 Tax=Streptomyces sp. NPDC006798 TaxID=3155462 RepID=UPI0033C15968
MKQELKHGVVVGTLLGGVTVRRTEVSDSQPWITEYELTGIRVSGRVQILPYYDELLVERNGAPEGLPTEKAWEFLPSAFSITYGGEPTWSGDGRGSLVVNGVALDGGTTWRTRRANSERFDVCRSGSKDAPAGARDKTRAIVRGLVELHQQDAGLVHASAVAFARFRRSRRLADLVKEHREVSSLLRELMGLNAKLVERNAVLDDDAEFERAIRGERLASTGRHMPTTG